MYRKDRFHQFGLSDFNQPFGLKMNPENRWIKKSETIPWEEIEDRYAELFKSSTGMPAKPLRCALGSLLIQKQRGAYEYDLWGKPIRTVKTGADTRNVTDKNPIRYRSYYYDTETGLY